MSILGTPRRIVVYVTGLDGWQEDSLQVIKGPPASRAYDADGRPTRAAEGFAQSKGVPVGDLEVREIDGGEYVAALVHQRGQPTVQLLAEAIPGWIENIRFDKTMRWNNTGTAFSRPIRWFLALYGPKGNPFHLCRAGLWRLHARSAFP